MRNPGYARRGERAQYRTEETRLLAGAVRARPPDAPGDGESARDIAPARADSGGWRGRARAWGGREGPGAHAAQAPDGGRLAGAAAPGQTARGGPKRRPPRFALRAARDPGPLSRTPGEIGGAELRPVRTLRGARGT